MTETFVLRIELGNAAMQQPSDVADALETLADKLYRAGIDGTDLSTPQRGTIKDLNGNTLGSWEVQ